MWLLGKKPGKTWESVVERIATTTTRNGGCKVKWMEGPRRVVGMTRQSARGGDVVRGRNAGPDNRSNEGRRDAHFDESVARRDDERAKVDDGRVRGARRKAAHRLHLVPAARRVRRRARKDDGKTYRLRTRAALVLVLERRWTSLTATIPPSRAPRRRVLELALPHAAPVARTNLRKKKRQASVSRLIKAQARVDQRPRRDATRAGAQPQEPVVAQNNARMAAREQRRTEKSAAGDGNGGTAGVGRSDVLCGDHARRSQTSSKRVSTR